MWNSPLRLLSSCLAMSGSHVCLIALLCILDDLWQRPEPLAATGSPVMSPGIPWPQRFHMLRHIQPAPCSASSLQLWLSWGHQWYVAGPRCCRLFRLKKTPAHGQHFIMPSISFSSFAVSFWPGSSGSHWCPTLKYCFHHKNWSVLQCFTCPPPVLHFDITGCSEFQAAWLLANKHDYPRCSRMLNLDCVWQVYGWP